MATQFLKEGYNYVELHNYVKVVRDLCNSGEIYDKLKRDNPESLAKLDEMKKSGAGISWKEIHNIIKANSAYLGFGKSIDDDQLTQMRSAAMSIEPGKDIPSFNAITEKRKEYDQKLVNDIETSKEDFAKQNESFEAAKKEKNKKRGSRIGRFFGVIGSVALTVGFFGLMASSVLVLGAVAAGGTMGAAGWAAATILGVGAIDFFSGRHLVGLLGKLVGHAGKKYRQAKANHIDAKQTYKKQKAARKAAERSKDHLEETRALDINHERLDATSYRHLDSTYDVHAATPERTAEAAPVRSDDVIRSFGDDSEKEIKYREDREKREREAAAADEHAEEEQSEEKPAEEKPVEEKPESPAKEDEEERVSDDEAAAMVDELLGKRDGATETKEEGKGDDKPKPKVEHVTADEIAKEEEKTTSDEADKVEPKKEDSAAKKPEKKEINKKDKEVKKPVDPAVANDVDYELFAEGYIKLNDKIPLKKSRVRPGKGRSTQFNLTNIKEATGMTDENLIRSYLQKAEKEGLIDSKGNVKKDEDNGPELGE